MAIEHRWKPYTLSLNISSQLLNKVIIEKFKNNKLNHETLNRAYCKQIYLAVVADCCLINKSYRLWYDNQTKKTPPLLLVKFKIQIQWFSHVAMDKKIIEIWRPKKFKYITWKMYLTKVKSISKEQSKGHGQNTWSQRTKVHTLLNSFINGSPNSKKAKKKGDQWDMLELTFEIKGRKYKYVFKSITSNNVKVKSMYFLSFQQ